MTPSRKDLGHNHSHIQLHSSCCSNSRHMPQNKPHITRVPCPFSQHTKHATYQRYTTSTSVTTTQPATSSHQCVCLSAPMHTRSGLSVAL